jgi:hypothetical protein
MCCLSVHSGSGGIEMIERRYAAYSAASEKVVFYLWPGILGSATAALLLAAVSAQGQSGTAYGSRPQGDNGAIL